MKGIYNDGKELSRNKFTDSSLENGIEQSIFQTKM